MSQVNRGESDFTVIVEDFPFFLHKSLLSEKSTFFAAMFRIRPDYISVDLTKGKAETASGTIDDEQAEPAPIRVEDFTIIVKSWYGLDDSAKGPTLLFCPDFIFCPSVLEYPAMKHSLKEASRYLGTKTPHLVIDDDREWFPEARIQGTEKGITFFLEEDDPGKVETKGSGETNIVPHELLQVDSTRYTFGPSALIALNRVYDREIGESTPYRLEKVDFLILDVSRSKFAIQAVLSDPTGAYPSFQIERFPEMFSSEGDLEKFFLRGDIDAFLEGFLIKTAKRTFAHRLRVDDGIQRDALDRETGDE